MTPGKENYVISNDDVTCNDSWTPQGGRSTDVEDEGDSLTPKGGRPIGGTAVRIKKKEEKG